MREPREIIFLTKVERIRLAVDRDKLVDSEFGINL